MSVKVAVRLRPFNDRQKRLDSRLVVDMQNPTTILKGTAKQSQRRFAFDYSFWSFDGYEEDQNGFLKAAPGSKYADQQYVFKQVGRKVLQNAYNGYNCSLFAYGQTGAGKSYSMIGYGVNKGIVPIICQQIFKKANQKNKDQQFEVYVSMLEIYNQEIQDLTIDISQRPIGGLKIRQSRLLGVFVQGIKKHFVDDYQDIQRIMEQGARNRTVAVTQMNASSSRAHTMISIQFKQKIMVKNVKTEKVSVLNLIDLAGSQRQSKTGATGQRLKQAAGINLSLTVLGQVITSLCDITDGQAKFIPYRNASLTRILQNALGGNSQTIMICAISPSENNYDQTLSTLRFAQKAKKIKNKPVVNQKDTDKLIKQINIQNQKLQQKLIQAQIKINNLTNNPKTKQEIELQQKQIEEMNANAKALMEFLQEEKQTKKQKKDKQNQDRINNKLMARQAHKDQQRIVDKKQIQKLKQTNKKLPPYLQNLSKDIIIHKKLNILIQKGKYIAIRSTSQLENQTAIPQTTSYSEAETCEQNMPPSMLTVKATCSQLPQPWAFIYTQMAKELTKRQISRTQIGLFLDGIVFLFSEIWIIRVMGTKWSMSRLLGNLWPERFPSSLILMIRILRTISIVVGYFDFIFCIYVIIFKKIIIRNNPNFQPIRYMIRYDDISFLIYLQIRFDFFLEYLRSVIYRNAQKVKQKWSILPNTFLPRREQNLTQGIQPMVKIKPMLSVTLNDEILPKVFFSHPSFLALEYMYLQNLYKQFFTCDNCHKSYNCVEQRIIGVY